MLMQMSAAVNGLDDLRAWTLGKRIQPHIDLYVSKATFQGIKRMFLYLVSREFATGGGDIPEFVWHVCIENALPFEIQDTSIMVTPFLVHHGRLFTTPTPLSAPPAPSFVEKAERFSGTTGRAGSVIHRWSACEHTCVAPHLTDQGTSSPLLICSSGAHYCALLVRLPIAAVGQQTHSWAGYLTFSTYAVAFMLPLRRSKS
ncbi:hypothetical protein GGX14DRAFT_641931 [Mycena pura]|uniref:Uncharacterized protein n=1 Tax=Mycena pura TaxID=153505 RepID=A0AAD6YQ78_9AGAR|nr:hypothetical protein GGX14DRAFT_641931 [Mycena pura]